MLDEATRVFRNGSRALIVAAVTPDGAPHATRGWGISLDMDERTARLLLPADDDVVIAALGARDARIAVTAGDIDTLHSTQIKGRALHIERATETDELTAAEYVDGFAAAVERVDGTPRTLIERLVPTAFVACTITIDDVFDQTPGPGAGASVTGNR
ncbi:MAG TPA: pyridoxamine 5'-phosphate oxidase family protein [Acidimicrobiales bacterium]|jgi:hypothetical protein|nr:pyridoxamine 5'-phosphate oxidase family protein [Acidimicrobiales bacterium]